MRRAAMFLILAIASLGALGARCIENTTIRVDDEGYTHLQGEIFNDTDIQGRFIILRAQLIGPGGEIIAEKDAGLCPPALQPRGQSVFDIRFDQPHLPAYATYSLRAVTGLASDRHLPDPKIAVTSTSAKRETRGVVVRIDVKNNSGKEYFNLKGCAAVYDASGKVVGVKQATFHNENEQGTPIPGGLGPAPDYFLLHIPQVSGGATRARGWVYVEEPLGDQGYQPVMTDLLPITR